VAHPMYPRVRVFDGSSLDADIAATIGRKASSCKRVLVVLDSNHTHEHVLVELRLYTPLVTVGSYCVIFDTIIEDLEGVEFTDRPWRKGNNPKTAVAEFLRSNDDLMVDSSIDDRLLISGAFGSLF